MSGYHQALVMKSHDLLQEEVITCVYNMASVDMSKFHKQFLPNFLQQVNTIDSHQKDVLAEHFTTEQVSTV